jgi:uncharacterized protein YyaL (SSP411 family)
MYFFTKERQSMPNVETLLRAGRYYSSFLSYDLAKIYLKGSSSRALDTMVHLDAAVQWICRAQDAGNDGGVPRSYSMVYNPYFGRKGWIPSYPETTGYIIPTMSDYARLTNRQDIFERAVRMADWECDVQMENGAVQGGTVGQARTPAVFNTGQVIFGWVRAFQETGNERYLKSAERAGTFLADQQDQDGAWRKKLSDYASDRLSFYTYNTRTAWALLLLSTIANNARFKEAAIRNIEFALGQQLENGWFKSNCLNDPSKPLLHTIAYCIRGILESGVLLGNQAYIEKAKKAADALISRQRPDGSLAGRFNEKWEPTASWSCLTGDAQISINWSRLFQITGDPRYWEPVRKVNNYLKRVQVMGTGNPGLDGGIAGSDPIDGQYGRFEILNWAVKFFMDALMLELATQGERS